LLSVLASPVLIYLTLAGNLVLFCAATGFFYVEVGANPNVDSWFDAIWWAFATVTTVGYGDIVPVTAGGRIIAIFLMVTGASFFFGFTAVLISLFSALTTEEIIEEEQTTQHEFALLLAEVQALRAELQKKSH
jgi:voltage-gated potassium channel